MGKNQSRRHRGMVPKTTAGLVHFIFKVTGIVVALSPAIKGVSDSLFRDKNPANIPAAIAYDYTGYDINSGGFNQAQLGVGAAAIGIGIALNWVGKIVSKAFR